MKKLQIALQLWLFSLFQKSHAVILFLCTQASFRRLRFLERIGQILYHCLLAGFTETSCVNWPSAVLTDDSFCHSIRDHKSLFTDPLFDLFHLSD